MAALCYREYENIREIVTPGWVLMMGCSRLAEGVAAVEAPEPAVSIADAGIRSETPLVCGGTLGCRPDLRRG